MNISIGSLRRPIFFASLVILMLLGGLVALKKMPVNLMPNVDIPFVLVSVQYPGAGPKEVESVLTIPMEEELISLEGLKKIKSVSQDSYSQISLEFNMGLSTDTIEQKVRDRIALVKSRFPKAVLEPTVMKYDMNALPIMTLAVRSTDVNRVKLTDWVDRELKPQISQIPKIGRIEILGGLKREIQVDLDPKKVEFYRLSFAGVADQIARSGENSPGGLIPRDGLDVGVRSIGEFSSLQTLKDRVIGFQGGEVPIRVSSIGEVRDGAVRETTRAYFKNEPALAIEVYRQSGANIVEITDKLKDRVQEISANLQQSGSDIRVDVIVDGSKEIRDNVWDVQETIILGILLTIIVVYFFLASARSTFITGLALPNSLLGAFVLMYLMGFSINVMTLLALSLAVGLLVDDAIVVRENIFKHIEAGKSPLRAAIDGVNEVALAVIATTIAIISVFGPVAFIPGIIGQFFKEFGLTVSFAMLISLFDALTIAPMLSAYWAGSPNKHEESKSFWSKLGTPFSKSAAAFGRFQDRFEISYARVLNVISKKPLISALVGIGLAISLFFIAPFLPSTFVPAAEPTTLIVDMKLPSGTPLDEGEKFGKTIQQHVEKDPGVLNSILTIGNASQETDVISLKINLKPSKEREQKGSQIQESFRKYTEDFQKTLPEGSTIYLVKDDGSGGGTFPVSFSILANDNETALNYAKLLVERLQKTDIFLDVHSTNKPGRPELTVKVDSSKAGRFGISEGLVGEEVRGRIEGILAGRFRDTGREYDIRVRAKDGAATFVSELDNILVPNLDATLVRLKDVATVSQGVSMAKLERASRAASITVNANLAPKVGLGEATDMLKKVTTDEIKPPAGVRIVFEGEAEDFAEMGLGFASAIGFGLVLLYLVLASLYESFFVPVLVMAALPLAIGGAFIALLMAGQGIDMYSLIGILLLMGVATKNSILIVDTVSEHLREESNIDTAKYIKVVIESSVRRLRPIIMTSMALVAGMIPIAVGLNEASAQRTSMGTAVIGGTISSTILTLVILPILLILVQKRVTKAAVAIGDRGRKIDAALKESQTVIK